MLNNRDYTLRKVADQIKPEGERIIVVIDKEPIDRISVADAIIHASKRMERDEELAISFIQEGF